MFPEPSPRVTELRRRLLAFMDEHIYPNEDRYCEQLQAGDRWQPPILLEELKAKAKAAGLWNLFLPGLDFSGHEHGAGLTNLEYAPLCEIMGRSSIAPEAAASRRNSFLLCHDRARRRFVRRHQYPRADRAPRR